MGSVETSQPSSSSYNSNFTLDLFLPQAIYSIYRTEKELVEDLKMVVKVVRRPLVIFLEIESSG